MVGWFVLKECTTLYPPKKIQSVLWGGYLVRVERVFGSFILKECTCSTPKENSISFVWGGCLVGSFWKNALAILANDQRIQWFHGVFLILTPIYFSEIRWTGLPWEIFDVSYRQNYSSIHNLFQIASIRTSNRKSELTRK